MHEEFGAQVNTIMVVVDREQRGKENIERLGYKFHPLAKISELVECLLQSSCISEEQAGTVLNYVKKACMHEVIAVHILKMRINLAM